MDFLSIMRQPRVIVICCDVSYQIAAYCTMNLLPSSPLPFLIIAISFFHHATSLMA